MVAHKFRRNFYVHPTAQDAVSVIPFRALAQYSRPKAAKCCCRRHHGLVVSLASANSAQNVIAHFIPRGGALNHHINGMLRDKLRAFTFFFICGDMKLHEAGPTWDPGQEFWAISRLSLI